MGYQLTTVLRRLGVWPRPTAAGGVVPEPATGRGARATGDAAEVHRRTLAATGSALGARETAALWATLSPAEQMAVLEPVRLAREARQADATTCGSAVLTMLAATGDPSLALWLVTGRLGRLRPPELADAPPAALAVLSSAPAERRFVAVQRVLKRQATSRALLGLPWPATLGTPPWGAARAARFPGVTYGHQPVDDTDDGRLAEVLDAVERAVDAGVPVPLYSGGDSALGWATAVPRHVVLVVGRSSLGLRIFEPGHGRMLTLSRAALAAGDRPQAALGGWQHLTWVLLPR